MGCHVGLGRILCWVLSPRRVEREAEQATAWTREEEARATAKALGKEFPGQTPFPSSGGTCRVAPALVSSPENGEKTTDPLGELQ